MRILHIDTGRELRGGQRQLLLLARGLAGRGHSQVILARRGTPLFSAALEQGMEVNPLRPATLRALSSFADIIHAHDARAHTSAAVLAADRPLVVSRRVAFPVRAGRLSRWKYDRAQCFLAVSQFVRLQLLNAGVPEEKISVVYDGIEVPQCTAAVARQPVVLAPHTDDPQKGSALAAQACRAAGIELQFSRTLETDLPSASLFLYLSYSEGLGSAILLAMALRTPVVASRVGGIPEIVEHGRTGLLVNNAVEDITAAIRTVLSDPAAAAGRADAAYRRVLEQFTDAIMVAQTEQAYHVAMGRIGTK